MQLGDGVNDGSLPNSSAISNNSILTFNLVGSQTYGNEISGSGTLELSGANTYSGTTTLNGGGTLTLSGNRTATAGIMHADAGTLNIQNGNFSLGSSAFYVGSQGGNATVNQTAGSIGFSGGLELLIGNALQAGCISIYNLSGGAITGAASTSAGVRLGVNSAVGAPQTNVFNLSGTGVLSFPAAYLALGRSDTSANFSDSTFNQTGGSATFGTLTLGGKTAGSTNANATLNLTGGTFLATNFTYRAAGDTNAANITIGGTANVTLPAFPTARGAASTAILTFDGGSLSNAGAASTVYLQGLDHAYLTTNGATFNVGAAITVSQSLENASALNLGTLTKNGAGTLTLAGTNSYSGGTTINAGILTLGAQAAAVNPGAVTVAGGGYNLGALTTVTNGAITMSSGAISNGTVVGASYTFSGGTASAILAGTGALTNNSGTTTLSGANTFSGGVTLNSGTLSLGNNAAVGTGTLTINGGALNVTAARTTSNNNPQNWNGDFEFVGGNTLNLGTGAVTLGGDRSVTVTASTLTVGGAIGGGAFGLTKAGAGILTLTGSNTYSGGTTISAGTLAISGAGVLGNGNYAGDIVNNSTLNFDSSASQTVMGAISGSGAVSYTGTGGLNLMGNITGSGSVLKGTGATGDMTLSGTGNDFTGDVGFSASGRTTVYVASMGNGSGNIRILQSDVFRTTASIATTKGVVLPGGNSVNMQLDADSGTLTINGLVTDTVPVSLYNPSFFGLGDETNALNGALYIGSTTAGGTLKYTGTGDTSDRIINLVGTTGGATLDQSGSGLLKFTSDLKASGAGAKTLSLQGTGNGELAGAIVNSTSATSLKKDGTGTWTLSGVNTYSGITTVSGGTLRLLGDNNGSGDFIVGNSAATSAQLVIQGGAITCGMFTVVSAGNLATGIVQQTSGAVVITNVLQMGFNATGAGYGEYNLAGGSLNAANGINIGQVSSNTGVFNMSGGSLVSGGTLHLGRWTGLYTNVSGIFNQSGGTATVSSLAVSASVNSMGALNISNGVFSAITFSALASQAGSTGHVYFGQGSMVTLSNFPTARGAGAYADLTFDGGTLSNAAGGTTYLQGLNKAYLTSNGATFSVGANIAVAQAFENYGSQQGRLQKTGPGTLTLSGANSYSGGTTINNGLLALAGSGTLGAGKIDIGVLGTFDVTAATAGSYTLAAGQSLTNRGTFTGGLIIGSGANVSGGGVFNGNVTNGNGGLLTPGVGGDTNFFTHLTLAGGSTNSFWVGSTAANHDMSVVSNSLSYTGDGTLMPGLKLDLSAYTWLCNDTIVLYDNRFSGPSALDGTNQWFTFSDIALGSVVDLKNGTIFSALTDGGSATNQFRINYDLTANGSSQFNDIALTAIPEPASLNLLLAFGAAYYLRRRTHNARQRRNQ